MSVRPLFFFIVLLSFLPVVASFVPRVLGIGPAVCALVGVIAYRLQMQRWPEWNKTGLAVAAGVSGLALLSALWSFNPEFAVERAGKIALVLFFGGVLFSVVNGLDDASRNLFRRIFPIFVLVAAGVCIADLYTQGVFYNQLYVEKHPVFNYSWLNRQIVAVTFMALLVLYMIYGSGWPEGRKKMLGGLVLLALGLILYRTDSQSAHLTVMIAGIFWLLFPTSYKPVWFLLGGMIVVAVVAAPWIVHSCYTGLAGYARQFSWLDQAYAADRLEIWDFVMRKALENPLYGFGIEATRHVEHFETAKMYTPHDHVLHPHNFVVQLWIEFGALGAAAFCGFAAYMLRQMWAEKCVIYRRLCLIMFMTMIVTAAISYGLWQSWWLGLMTLLAAYVMILRPEERKNAA